MDDIELISGAWHGDKSFKIRVPASWDFRVVNGKLNPNLGNEEINKLFRDPIGSPPLTKLAAGKNRAAIVVDDITRPTPSARLIPFILRELRQAGIRDRAITIIVAGGTHKPASVEETRKKLGEIPSQIKVISHNCTQDLKYLGPSNRGTPIYVNHAVLDCDLKIGVGCIYPHSKAGFSGGSKILVPGLCGIETVKYLHRNFKGARRGVLERADFRKEIEEVTQKIGLDFIVNAVLNQKREITGLFAGDRLEAHRKGAEYATKIYTAPIIEDADIVIADVYPFDAFLHFAYYRGLWPLATAKKSATKIVVGDFSMGTGSHELGSLSISIGERIVNRIKRSKLHELFNPVAQIKKLSDFFKKRNRSLVFISPGLTKEELNRTFPKAEVYKTWDRFLPELESRHPAQSVKGVVYRCSPLLIPKGG